MHRVARACLVIALLLLPSLGAAQDRNVAAGVDPGRPFRIAVLGDSLADGLWGAFYRGYFKRRDRVVVERLAVNSAGFTAYNFEQQLTAALAKGPVDLIVFQVGANDRQRAFAVGNSRDWAVFKTEKWQTIYRQNIRHFLALVQEKKVPIAWVGLPIMRKEEANEESRFLNGIYRTLVTEHTGIFIDIWALTANKDREYDPYFEDESGRKKRFRADDGIHFTDLGYEIVAAHALKAMRERLPELRLWRIE